MDEEKKSVPLWQTKFLNEPAYRWAGFAIAITFFLFVWGRMISLLAEGGE